MHTIKNYLVSKQIKAEQACLAMHNLLRFRHGITHSNRYRLGYGAIRDSARVSFILLSLLKLIVFVLIPGAAGEIYLLGLQSAH